MIASIPEQFTEICISQNQFIGFNLATSTQACYNPLEVWATFGIEFFVAVSVILVSILIFKKK